ncbi:MAG: ribbon-helix-helix protein, CopG family [Candidatus Kerfeldbacteria bacterium]|nr:ribbon-helix-helix protein, CopG family [Candidatus Kerfeldbacteria bacterium]
MNTTQNISITMPKAMIKEAKRLAQGENRTMSELIREALRRYQRDKRWDEMNAYGRAQAKKLGITSRDVGRIIDEYRREKRSKA